MVATDINIGRYYTLHGQISCFHLKKWIIPVIDLLKTSIQIFIWHYKYKKLIVSLIKSFHIKSFKNNHYLNFNKFLNYNQ